MATGIIQLLVILLPAILAYVAKCNQNANDPVVILSNKNEEIDEEIATHNSGRITDDVNLMLNQLSLHLGDFK